MNLHEAIKKRIEDFMKVKPILKPVDKKKEKEEVHFHRLETVFGEHSKKDSHNLKEDATRWVDNENVIHRHKVKEPHHIEAINRYTDDSTSLNAALHHNHDGTEPTHGRLPGFGKKYRISSDHNEHVKTQVKDLDDMFKDKKNHVGVNHIVYTGLKESPQKTLDRESKRIGKPAEHFHAHLPAYTSTSTNDTQASRFSWGRETEDGYKHILKIHVPANHPSVSLQHHSNCPREQEVLLHRGTRLKIHAKPTIDDSGVRIWHAHVVGHHLDEIK